MRVEHEGRYAAVASLGGAPENPDWYHNMLAEPLVELQDGAVRREYTARLLDGAEKQEWWVRAVEAFPTYEEYQAKTGRDIPVFLLEPKD
jgi:deazaflavin-dependent oxidoreductase (nitroreductase family)